SGPATVRVGLELRPLAGAAIRTGLAGDRLAAGADFRWHDAQIVYAFENRALEPLHRVGLTIGFGATTGAAHSAALEGEQRALQERLDAAFRDQEEKRRQDVATRADALRAKGDLRGAIELLGADEDGLAASASLGSLYQRCLREQGAALEAAGDWSGASI